MDNPKVAFGDLRDDWYRGADLMARLIDQSRRGGPRLTGFPAQWAPVFVHFGANWADVIAPPLYVPIVSDLPLGSLLDAIEGARRQGRLRQLVEAVATLDPLVADVLHKLDRRPLFDPDPIVGAVPLTSWQSYGRPEILDFQRRALGFAQRSSSTAVLLPCARRRPYSGSKTHRRLRAGVQEMGAGPFDEIVISSLGVVPARLWNDPVVLAYDSGVPDIYRVLRLMRDYFAQTRYPRVIDCLEFEPYRDCLRIIHAEGLVDVILEGPARKVKRLPPP